MRRFKAVLFVCVVGTGVVHTVAADAAIGLPDTESCNSGGYCLHITNTNPTGGSAVFGEAPTGSVGVAGSAQVTGVQGTGQFGVIGSSSVSGGIGVSGNGEQ